MKKLSIILSDLFATLSKDKIITDCHNNFETIEIIFNSSAIGVGFNGRELKLFKVNDDYGPGLARRFSETFLISPDGINEEMFKITLLSEGLAGNTNNFWVTAQYFKEVNQVLQLIDWKIAEAK